MIPYLSTIHINLTKQIQVTNFNQNNHLFNKAPNKPSKTKKQDLILTSYQDQLKFHNLSAAYYRLADSSVAIEAIRVINYTCKHSEISP